MDRQQVVVEPAVPKKTLGQHWLDDDVILESIVESADINSQDYVLEIGPGLGSLTRRLLSRGCSILALEFDPELASTLVSRLKQEYSELSTDKLQVQQGDIRTFDYQQLPPDYKVVANIPYYLTSHLLRRLSDSQNKPTRAAILIQKEVAERVAAVDGKMSIIACITQFYYQVKLGPLVPAHYFTPPPKVDSQVLCLQARTNPLFSLDERQFFRTIKAGFSEKRKTIKNALKGGLRLSPEALDSIFEQAGLDSTRRAETLTMDDWHRLYQIIELDT